MKKLFFWVALAVLIPLGFLGYKKWEAMQATGPTGIALIEFQPQNQPMEPGSRFGIRSIVVRDGYVYELLLDNGQMIEGHLTRPTRDEAITEVIELFKNGSSPTVTLLRYADGYWIVDITVVNQQLPVSLVKLLEEKHLTF